MRLSCWVFLGALGLLLATSSWAGASGSLASGDLARQMILFLKSKDLVPKRIEARAPCFFLGLGSRRPSNFEGSTLLFEALQADGTPLEWIELGEIQPEERAAIQEFEAPPPGQASVPEFLDGVYGLLYERVPAVRVPRALLQRLAREDSRFQNRFPHPRVFRDRFGLYRASDCTGPDPVHLEAALLEFSAHPQGDWLLRRLGAQKLGLPSEAP